MATLKMKDAQGRWIISEDPTAIKYTKSQTLTNSQRQTAQANMGISSTDNTFKNTIETIVNSMGLSTGGNCLENMAFTGTGTDYYDGRSYCGINPDWQYILLLGCYQNGSGNIYMEGIIEKDYEGEYMFSRGHEQPSYWFPSFDIVYGVNPGHNQYYETAISYYSPDYTLIAIPLQAWHYCLREDTLIPMEDGTYKAIKDVQPREKVAFYNTFNHDPEMKYNVVCVPSVTSNPPKYKTFTFSNGSILNIGGNHMLFNTETDAIVGSDEWKVGMHGIGEDGSEIELISIEEKENTEGYTFYNMFTRHYRYLANGVLCGHSQAALGAEYVKVSNKPYRFKDKEYMAYLRRKHTEREILTKGYTPLSAAADLGQLNKEYGNLEEKEEENKKYLNETDYKVTKYNSGLISEEEYRESEIKREEARQKIREIREKKQERDEKIKQIKLQHLDDISPVKGVW